MILGDVSIGDVAEVGTGGAGVVGLVYFAFQWLTKRLDKNAEVRREFQASEAAKQRDHEKQTQSAQHDHEKSIQGESHAIALRFEATVKDMTASCRDERREAQSQNREAQTRLEMLLRESVSATANTSSALQGIQTIIQQQNEKLEQHSDHIDDLRESVNALRTTPK